MDRFEIKADTANKALCATDDIIEKAPTDYARGVKDAIGWLLGHYDPPYCFEESDHPELFEPSGD